MKITVCSRRFAIGVLKVTDYKSAPAGEFPSFGGVRGGFFPFYPLLTVRRLPYGSSVGIPTGCQ
jgi:hypothetical protein